MIQVKDNVLPAYVFELLQEHCKSDFEKVTVGEKEFLVLPTPEYVYPALKVDGHEIVLTFIRQAHNEFDTDLRIHADNIINGHKTSFASVLYINDEDVSDNGTAFWKHCNYGYSLADDVSNEEFDRLLTEDANDAEKWKQVGYISARPNRMLTYGSQQFHSKWPAKIEQGKRIVLVTFYKKL